MPDRRTDRSARFVLQKTTLIDYPGRVAATVFLPGCHLRCPYCHNPALVDSAHPAASQLHYIDDVEFAAFLERRARFLGGVVFSGGEALLNPDLPALIRMVRIYRLPVKLDTAGLLPGRLKGLLDAGVLDYVAVDLKTLPERYDELGWMGPGRSGDLLAETLGILAESGVGFQVRTTVVPPLVDESILTELAGLAGKAKLWVWQTYRGGETLDPAWSDIAAPDEDTLMRLSHRISCRAEILVR